MIKKKKCADYGCEITKEKLYPWLKRINWGTMGNRAYMRSICDKATTSQTSGDIVTAEKLYRLLIKMNPGDNMGVRYLIAGLFAGLSPQKIELMFEVAMLPKTGVSSRS